ncbi:MAG: FxsA family protein [Cocleimonas sp.]|nr:FxsA family protein [Cocleimonas sp.]
MRASHIFLVLFLVVPVVEIYLLIQVGSLIGALPTILLILATAIIGAGLLRQQGLSTLARFQNNLASGSLPAQEMIEGILLAVGGALLMTPGFVTDAMGFFCLIPFTRKALAHYIMKRSAVQVQAGVADFARSARPGSHGAKGGGVDNNTYEGEFVRKEDERLNRD